MSRAGSGSDTAEPAGTGKDLSSQPDPPDEALLRDVVVVEAGTYMSAPLASMMLAQLGAEVIKVEPPSGDPFRRFSFRHEGTSATWVSVNHGKASVSLDLKSETGREEMLSLLARADVFLHNWRPTVVESLGLGERELATQFPALIQVAISGFGSTGPRSGGPVFDGLLQAASGFAAREADGTGPRMNRSFIADKVTAHFATQAVLAALLRRTRTGRGAFISLPMLDAMAHFNFPDLAQDRTFLPPAPQRDLPLGRSAILETADGFLLIAPVSGRQVRAALDVVGHPEWKDELKAIDDPVRFLDELLDRLETVTSGWTTQQCEDLFREADVPAVAVLSLDGHLQDPQTIHNEVYSLADSPFGPIRRVHHPVRIDGDRLPAVGPAPVLSSPRST